jgi:citrate synthase
VCFIDGDKGILQYRGYPIEDLAVHTTFEETAFLLIKGHLPNRQELELFNKDLISHRKLKHQIIDLLKCLPEAGHPMHALSSAVAALGMFYPGNHVTDAEGRYFAVIRVLAKVPTIVAAFHRLRHGDRAIEPREDLGHAANFLYMLTEKEPDPIAARILDVCLILHAEHSMNASTFAARVTASTLADPFQVIASAVGALSGPLHGGANEEVLDMLNKIGTVEGAQGFVEDAVRSKKKISGFGHRVYKVKDPRAPVLQKLAVELFKKVGHTPLYDIACEVEKFATSHLGSKGVYPNVDFYSGIVYERLGIPRDLFTAIFGIARAAGWLAHFEEQIQKNRIYRPDQVYKGDLNLKIVPIDKRS